ncbi:AMP-binding protein [Nonomuraea wenchangensis]|uniref:AMP-binding protein n=1 Tax=Nonomuraea wenchangensis TaxID=568860 RepID=UPI003435EDAE
MGTGEDLWDYIPDHLRRRFDLEFSSIPNAVRIAARRQPDDEAIVDGALRMTFADLEKAMIDAVRATRAMGIEPGDRVGLWAPNCWQWIIAALGVQGAGGILVPVNTRFKGAEAAFVLRKSGAKALFVVNDFLDTDYHGMLRAADPDLPALQRVIAVSGKAGAGQIAWDDWMAGGSAVTPEDAQASIDAVTPDTISDIMFTSGTTGHPKGVMLTHGQSLRAHGWLAYVMRFRRGDRYLIIPPFFHTFGYKAGWMACIVHGVTILPEAVFTVDHVLEMIDRERVSVLLGPPTLFQGILDAPDRDRYDVSSIRVTMASAASVSPELFRRMRDELAAEVVHSAYGLTEATSLVTTVLPTADEFDDIATTVGRAALDIEVRVVDEEGQDVPPGQPGELLCRGYNVMRGYWEEPELTAEVITEDGWLKTGDIAEMDERGFIKITDRKKDMVIVGGFNVYPAEVERILGTYPKIDSIAVVGIPDERLGEVVAAFVVPRAGSAFDEDEFVAWARERIANFKVPRAVFVTSDLPRNASMKVLKHARASAAKSGL